MNVVLDHLDGNKKVPNCKMWGTTNHIKIIEDAVGRRFEKFYLGLIEPSSKVFWINKTLLKEK
jgi:hypothetical protein